MGRVASAFYWKKTEKITEKREIIKSEAVTFIRTMISFAFVTKKNSSVIYSHNQSTGVPLNALCKFLMIIKPLLLNRCTLVKTDALFDNIDATPTRLSKE